METQIEPARVADVHQVLALGSACTPRSPTPQRQGAARLKAITSVTNTGSIAFHRALGFEVRIEDDYNGPGQAMVVFTRALPFEG